MKTTRPRHIETFRSGEELLTHVGVALLHARQHQVHAGRNVLEVLRHLVVHHLRQDRDEVRRRITDESDEEQAGFEATQRVHALILTALVHHHLLFYRACSPLHPSIRVGKVRQTVEISAKYVAR